MDEMQKKYCRSVGVPVELFEKFKRNILFIKYAVSVDFDLSGLLDNLPISVTVGYDIPLYLNEYFSLRRKFKKEVIECANDLGFSLTGDSIEDYGKYLYFVFNKDGNIERVNNNEC